MRSAKSRCACVSTYGVLAALLPILMSATAALAQTVIVDNTDSGFTVSGTWNTGTATNDYGTGYSYKNTRTSSPYNTAQWKPTLPTAGSYQVAVWYPTHSGTTVYNNAYFTVYHGAGSTVVNINQQNNAGTWVSLGIFTFPAGFTDNARVVLSDQANRTNRVVLADAVRFVGQAPVQLTMAVSPPGTGTTTPAEGGPYLKNSGEVVSISAMPANGYVFYRWEVSGGANAANPNSANTTVIMDQTKTVTAVFGEPLPEFRGMWVDAFHIGMQNAAQVDQMINLAVQGNFNAIVPEVLAYHDNQVGSHGAYWRSNIVPQTTYVTPTFDPLEYMVQQAHAHGLQVHCWLVAFRVSSIWPPANNPYLAAHPEWLKVPKASIGTVAPVGSYYEFDPASPDVQNYLASVVRELVTDYEIDGIHWDYIRSTAPDSGYPADSSYANSGLKRFQRIYNRADVPNATGDAQWDDFRRRSISEVVRRMRWEIPLITSNPRQPVRYSAAVVTWSPCSTNFHNTRPYYEVFSDWEDWQSKGYLDSPVLMAYFDEDGSYDQTYRDWVDNSIDLWRYDRQTIIGPGIYMNSFANSIIQLQYARAAGADGFCTYSYNVTNDAGSTWTDWYPYVATNFFTTTATVPTMPWRNPATATEGTLYGKVTDGSGQPVDDATVQVGALPTVKTDAAGYYIVTLIPATAGGTAYTVTGSKTGLPTVAIPSVQVTAGGVAQQDIALVSAPAPTILSWSSVRTHGSKGDMSIALPASGSPAIEMRHQGVTRLIVNFSAAVQAADGSLDTGDISVSDNLANNHTPASMTLLNGGTQLQVTFNPGGLPDGRRYTFSLAGKLVEAASPNRAVAGDIDCEVRLLVGDVNTSGEVNLIDVAAVRTVTHVEVSGGTFLYDMNVDGRINLIDAALAKTMHGHTVP